MTHYIGVLLWVIRTAGSTSIIYIYPLHTYIFYKQFLHTVQFVNICFKLIIQELIPSMIYPLFFALIVVINLLGKL